MPSLFLRERPDVNVLGGRGCEHRPGACVLQVTVLDEPAGLSAGNGERCFERVQDRTVVSRRVGRVPQVADMRWRDDAVIMKRLGGADGGREAAQRIGPEQAREIVLAGEVMR